MKQTTYYISGMHCASCELLIEKRLLKEHGVSAVDASLHNGSVVISSEKRPPHVSDINKWFSKDGYVFSEQPIQPKKEPLFYIEEGKQGIKVDKKLLQQKLKTLGGILLAFYFLYLIEKSGAAQYVSITNTSSLGLFFVFGIVAGLSSCAALIGGLLLSLSKNWNAQYGYDASTSQKMVPHMYFHVGRLFSYAIFGGVLGMLGKAVAVENVTLYATITIVVSVVMFIVGLQMSGVRWVQRFQIRLPKRMSRRVTAKEGSTSQKVPFILGAGTLVLPCGFTLVAQGLALTSGSALRGALMLGLFVLGTAVPLILIGLTSVKGTKNVKRGRVFSFYAGIILVMFALYNINGQLNVLGWPSVSDIMVRGNTSEWNGESSVISKNGQQVVTMVARDFEYRFTSNPVITAGIPTTLIVDDQGVLGCGSFLAARGLINGYVPLTLGKNSIDIGKPKKGTYKITCSMGMVPPITLTVQ